MGGSMMMQRPMGYKKGMTDKTFTAPKTALIAHSMKTEDKIYKRDREAAKILEKEAPKGMYSSIMSRKKAFDKVKASKKILGRMGGGMMKKPMGYNTGRSISTRGGGVDSSIIGKIRDAGPFKPIPLGKSRLTDEDRKKIRELMQRRSSRKKALDTAKRVASTVASAASPLAAAAYKLAKKRKNKDSDSDKAESLVGTSGSKTDL